MPRCGIYLSDVTNDRMDFDLDTLGISRRLAYLGAVARLALREAIPALSLNEWQALLDVTAQGLLAAHRADLSLTEQVTVFCVQVSMAGPDCNETREVNCAGLARKLGAMSVLQQCAVLEVCRRFWLRGDLNMAFDNYRDMLEAHGAKFSLSGAPDTGGRALFFVGAGCTETKLLPPRTARICWLTRAKKSQRRCV